MDRLSEMWFGRTWRRALGGVLAAAALVLLMGCGPGGQYLQDRGGDAADLLSMGITVSAKPGFALYGHCLAPVGFSHVDGYYLGVLNRRVGVIPLHERRVGLLLWGREESAAGQCGLREAGEPLARDIGILAGGSKKERGPALCSSGGAHNLHLGFVGVSALPCVVQVVDFVLGWTTLDIIGDDGGAAGAACQVARRQ